jgi:hypothetical protein
MAQVSYVVRVGRLRNGALSLEEGTREWGTGREKWFGRVGSLAWDYSRRDQGNQDKIRMLLNVMLAGRPRQEILTSIPSAPYGKSRIQIEIGKGGLQIDMQEVDPPSGGTIPVQVFYSVLLGVIYNRLAVCSRCDQVFIPSRGRQRLCINCSKVFRGLPPAKKVLFGRWKDRQRKRGVDLDSPEGKAKLRRVVDDLLKMEPDDWKREYLEKDEKRRGRPPKFRP